MALLTYPGVRRITYGYRFVYRGQLYKKVVGPSKALAKAAEAAERRRLEGIAFDARWGPRTPPLTPWVEALERYELAKAGKGSLQLDLTRLRWWAAFLQGDGYHYLQVVPPEALDRAKLALGAGKDARAPMTIRHYLATLRHLYQLAMRRWRVVTANPVQAVDFPKALLSRPALPMTAQLKTLVQVAEPTVRPLIIGALLTGLRQGALLGLTREDFALVPGWLRCRDQKGRKEYWIPVASPLRRIPAGQGSVWGVPRFPAKAWRRSRTAAGLAGLRFHDLRGVFSTTLAEAGVSHDVIRRLLGHGPRDVTDFYVRPRDPALVEAIKKLEGMYRTLNLSPFKPLKTQMRPRGS